jgi:cation diffusion facilitator CzcD-associated flavoprotein CzcO
MGDKQRVAIIGAGMSGLVAAKELLDEGHNIVIYEKQSAIGGNFTTGAAYERMKLTISNYFMAFSSFPPPMSQERRFWTREEYADYLDRFVAKFSLGDHIQFGADVQTVERVAEDIFRIAYRADGAMHHDAFSAVAVCRGPHRVEAPLLVQYPGAAEYEGQILHAAHWQGPEEFRGKRVVCVGMGETSADITREISDVAEACWLSMRSYPSLISRWYDGDTNDAYSVRIAHWAPRSVVTTSRREIEESVLSQLAPHDRIVFEWTKQAKPGRFYQKNCDFLDNVVSGRIAPVFSDISRLQGKMVCFEDGTSVMADVVMLCTGFEENSIPESWIQGYQVPDVRHLYKHEFHPEIGWRVAFIGWARPLHGGVPAASEMQSRFFALLCSGKRSLPPTDELVSRIKADADYEDELMSGSPRIRTLVHYTQYMDAMAELIGCKPNLEDYLDEPEFLYKLLFGSNIGACYRLRGPHADFEAAKGLIMSLPVASENSLVYGRLLPRLTPLALRTQMGEELANRIEVALEPFVHAG